MSEDKRDIVETLSSRLDSPNQGFAGRLNFPGIDLQGAVVVADRTAPGDMNFCVLLRGGDFPAVGFAGFATPWQITPEEVAAQSIRRLICKEVMVFSGPNSDGCGPAGGSTHCVRSLPAFGQLETFDTVAESLTINQHT